jgi:hypothetical protein
MPTHTFRLYVIPGSPSSEKAKAVLTQYCQQFLSPGSYTVEVIDAVKERGSLAAEDIFIVPALDRLLPAPKVRIMTDFGSVAKLAQALEGSQAHQDLGNTPAAKMDEDSA